MDNKPSPRRSTRKEPLPPWAESFMKPGITLRKRGNSYAVLEVSSSYKKGSKTRPVTQKYLGVLTEQGFTPKKTHSDSPSYEYGLSHFIFVNFAAKLRKTIFNSLPDTKNNIIKIGIVYFIYHSFDIKCFQDCLLTKKEASMLAGLASKISSKTINSIIKNIDGLFKEYFTDEHYQEAYSLLLLNKAKDIASFSYSPLVEELLRKVGKKYE